MLQRQKERTKRKSFVYIFGADSFNLPPKPHSSNDDNEIINDFDDDKENNQQNNNVLSSASVNPYLIKGNDVKENVEDAEDKENSPFHVPNYSSSIYNSSSSENENAIKRMKRSSSYVIDEEDEEESDDTEHFRDLPPYSSPFTAHRHSLISNRKKFYSSRHWPGNGSNSTSTSQQHSPFAQNHLRNTFFAKYHSSLSKLLFEDCNDQILAKEHSISSTTAATTIGAGAFCVSDPDVISEIQRPQTPPSAIIHSADLNQYLTSPLFSSPITFNSQMQQQRRHSMSTSLVSNTSHDLDHTSVGTDAELNKIDGDMWLMSDQLWSDVDIFWNTNKGALDTDADVDDIINKHLLDE